MQQPSKRRTRWALPALVLCICVGCDQWTKQLACEHLKQAPLIALLGDTLRVQYAENPGAFLGAGAVLSEPARFWILVVANAVFLGVIAAIVVAKKTLGPAQVVAVALLLAGGIGNLIDRVFRGGLVVDFLNLGIGPVRTGIFNVADMAIMAGFGLLIFLPTPKCGTPLDALPTSPPPHME